MLAGKNQGQARENCSPRTKMPRSRKPQPQNDIAERQFLAGQHLLGQSPLFAPLLMHAEIWRRHDGKVPSGAYAIVRRDGVIHVHPARRAQPQEWQWILGHCLLHLAFEHFSRRPFARVERGVRRHRRALFGRYQNRLGAARTDRAIAVAALARRASVGAPLRERRHSRCVRQPGHGRARARSIWSGRTSRAAIGIAARRSIGRRFSRAA